MRGWDWDEWYYCTSVEAQEGLVGQGLAGLVRVVD